MKGQRSGMAHLVADVIHVIADVLRVIGAVGLLPPAPPATVCSVHGGAKRAGEKGWLVAWEGPITGLASPAPRPTFVTAVISLPLAVSVAPAISVRGEAHEAFRGRSPMRGELD